MTNRARDISAAVDRELEPVVVELAARLNPTIIVVDSERAQEALRTALWKAAHAGMRAAGYELTADTTAADGYADRFGDDPTG